MERLQDVLFAMYNSNPVDKILYNHIKKNNGFFHYSIEDLYTFNYNIEIKNVESYEKQINKCLELHNKFENFKELLHEAWKLKINEELEEINFYYGTVAKYILDNFTFDDRKNVFIKDEEVVKIISRVDDIKSFKNEIMKYGKVFKYLVSIDLYDKISKELKSEKIMLLPKDLEKLNDFNIKAISFNRNKFEEKDIIELTCLLKDGQSFFARGYTLSDLLDKFEISLDCYKRNSRF